MKVEIIGTTATGEPVWTYVEGDKSSHIHTGIEKVLGEVIGKLSPEGNFVRTTVDLGRVVGKNNCVATIGAHSIVFAQREGRQGLTRFTQSAHPADTREVSIIIARDDKRDNRWTLITTFFGPLAPREPWDPGIRSEEERAAARKFWSSHALVWGTDPVVPNTETTHCPW